MAFTQVDSWSGVVATVVAPVAIPVGRIEVVYAWVTGMNVQGVPPLSNVPKGSQFVASVIWKNTGTVRVRGRFSIVLFSPAGVEYPLGLAQGQDSLAEPGSGPSAAPQTTPIALNEVGTYQLAVLMNLEPA